jgi:hypothetical protein
MMVCTVTSSGNGVVLGKAEEAEAGLSVMLVAPGSQVAEVSKTCVGL